MRIATVLIDAIASNVQASMESTVALQRERSSEDLLVHMEGPLVHTEDTLVHTKDPRTDSCKVLRYLLRGHAIRHASLDAIH
eukprot:4263848-Pleurochrysis_carterae.AAC.1